MSNSGHLDIVKSMGMGSNFDTPKIIQGLVDAEKIRVTNVEKDKENVETKLTALGSIITSVQGLETAFNAFAGTGPVSLATSSTPIGFGVTAKENAVETNYDIQVNSMAQVAKARSQNIADTGTNPGAGDLTIDVAGTSYAISIAADEDYADIVTKINASGAPVTASIIANAGSGANENYINIITAETGFDPSATAANALTISTDTLGIFDTTVRANYITQEATNSQITVDGDLTFIRTNNTITDALPGLDVNLYNTTSSAESLSLVVDPAATESNVQVLVDYLNDTISLINTETDNAPGTDTQKTFAADSTLNRLRRELGRFVSKVVSPDASLRGLMDIGISSNAQSGLLIIDSAKMATALNTNSREFNGIFTDSTSGIIGEMTTLVENMNDDLDGTLSLKKKHLEDKVEELDERILDLTDYIENYEARLLRQFTAMEEKVNASNAMKSYIEMQMDLMKKDS